VVDWRYAERILYVDLTARAARAEPTPPEWKRAFVGGAGFVARLLAGARPGDVALAAGPLSDGMAGRLSLGARPAGRSQVALSSLGGRLAAGLKQCGYDAVVFTGQLPSPGFILVDETGVAFGDATCLMGLAVPAAEAALARLTGEGYASLLLGPAAERGDSHAVVAHEGHYAGGSGVAAALGALGVKAVAVREPLCIPTRCTGCVRRCGPPARASAEVNAAGVDARAGALRRPGPGLADLLGTCQRVWHDRPGQVLRDALGATLSLLA
jgi:aldehyde:ferredoxin oxidoreductase